MNRRVEPEFLDELPPEDPRAIRSRRDLQRLNRWMRNINVMTDALQSSLNGDGARHLAELGAGDGTFMLRVAERLPVNGKPERRHGPSHHGSEFQSAQYSLAGDGRIPVILLDKQDIIRPETHTAFEALGWQTKAIHADVFDWLSRPSVEAYDGMLANLFLHHFSNAQLAEIFSHAARRTRLFIAIEPRRWLWSLGFSRLLWLIGCNEVTRHDARVSIRAGFTDHELSDLWPDKGNWSLLEKPANLASHLFIAQRKGSE